MSNLDKFGVNYTKLAQEGKLDPVIGRDDEIRRVIQILSRRTKNNPVLIGEPGVGKTAIVEGLAIRIYNNDIPVSLRNKIVYSLDLSEVIAGAKFKGEFEERLKDIIKEIKESNGEIITFIDEIHNIVGAGGGGGSIDAGNILKPMLARGELRVIGATTLDEYRNYIEKDSALERRFQPVYVKEPSVEDTIAILRGLKERYENYHQVTIDDSAFVAAAKLSDRFITNRFLPDKAIDLIDEAASRLKLEIDSVPTIIDILSRKIEKIKMEIITLSNTDKNNEEITRLKSELETLNDDLNEKNARWKNEKNMLNELATLNNEIELQKINADKLVREGKLDDAAKLLYVEIPSLEGKLNEKKDLLNKLDLMVSKEVSENEIKNIISSWCNIPLSKLSNEDYRNLKDLGSRLKRRVIGQDKIVDQVSKTLIRARTGLSSSDKPLGVFLSIGPTGVGKTELAKAVAAEMFSSERDIIRIDMSEYGERHTVSRLFGAPPGYIGYESGGELTEAVRRNPYSVILFDEIEKAHPDVYNTLLQVLDEGRMTDGLGNLVNFRNTVIFMTSNLGSEYALESNSRDNSAPEGFDLILKQAFKPEFINRIDGILYFNSLSSLEIEKIVSKEIEEIKVRIKDSHNIELIVEDSALSWLSTNGFNPLYGARPLKRLIENEVVDKIANEIVSENLHDGMTVKVVADTVADKELVLLLNN